MKFQEVIQKSNKLNKWGKKDVTNKTFEQSFISQDFIDVNMNHNF